jgi:hypothetical protein
MTGGRIKPYFVIDYYFYVTCAQKLIYATVLRAFENKEMRRIFVPKQEEEIERRRKLNNEERHNLYTLRSIIRVIESRGMRWLGQARGGCIQLPA